MKILNLYAGIGGNRKLWEDCQVTAVEFNPEIASVYRSLYPDDIVIVGDAHQYLLDHCNDGWDFIWASPPCQSHSQIRFNIGFKADREYKKVDAIYPEMALYQEIVLLKNWVDCMWVVENTIPYYEPLIPGEKIAGHLWWSNFIIRHIKVKNRGHRGGTVRTLQERKGIDISSYNIKNKRQILRNCVEPEVGKHVLDCAAGTMIKEDQMELFA